MLLAVLAAPASAQERARDLGAPHRSSGAQPAAPPGLREVPPASVEAAPEGAGEVQDLRAVQSSGVERRVFGDGRGEAVSWDDPELDLEPRGRVHFVLQGSGGWYGATASFDEAFGGALMLGLDFVLEPRLSLHLRVGAVAAGRTETQRALGLGDSLRSAVVSVRGQALLGVHLAQIFALRAGFELGEGYSFVLVGDSRSESALGFAFLGQAGLRLIGGRLELGVEVAAELREGNVLAWGGGASAVQELAPRVSGYLGVTL